MIYIEQLMRLIAEYPDYPVLADDSVPKGLTYKMIGQISGKVYAYLKKNNIGKEDMVMLFLPRGVQHILGAIGVMRSGAAFVTVEDTYEPERVEYIKKDCNCKLVIDSNVWAEIQKLEPMDGYEKADPHDAAMAIYTSGSTGHPKGVLHEYGNFGRMIESGSINGKCVVVDENDRFAMVAPLNFIAAHVIIWNTLYYRTFTYIVSYDVVKNPLKIGLFIMTNRITGTFLTPSHIRHMSVKLPGLKFCVIGSEPANNVYMDGLKIHNCYMMSESGFIVTHFELDREYDRTPVGKNLCGIDIKLITEDGREAAEGEEGEVVFKNDFVRGYLNLPDETEKHFKDGYYYTGDLAYRDENGELVICGRMNDMVKINGNRVEPGEIEEVAKKVLGLDFAACRIFQDARSTSVCLYYTDKALKMSDEAAREQMSHFLPYYMIPNFFVHIDEVPLKATGKMDRKALPKPETGSGLNDYEAPSDEIEARLCASFEKVLHIDKIGVNDDFYGLGGDSLASMEVLVDCEINGLNASDIFAGRTPKKIAKLWHEAYPDGESTPLAELNEKMLRIPQPLTAYQTYMIDYQLYTPLSTMLNLNVMFKVNFDVFPRDKVVCAINRAISNHPALLTRFQYGSGGNFEQVYDPSFAPDLHIEKVDSFEFRFLKDDLVKPFKLFNSRMYRCRIFDVEGQGYLFFDVHHTLFDGTSFQVLLGDMLKSVYDAELEPDYYYAMLYQQESMLNSERSREAKEYYERLYGADDFALKPTLDHDSRDNTVGHYSVDMNRYDTALDMIESKYELGRNAFFNTVVLLSLAIYNKCRNVQCTWTYNGRDDLTKSSMIGLLLKDIPIMLRLHKNDKITEIYKQIQDQVADGLAYSFYPYTVQSARVVEDDRICFLYQRNIRDAGGADFETVEIRQNSSASENAFDVQVLDDSTGLSLTIDYAASLYEESSVVKFASVFIAVFEFLTQCDDDATMIELVKKVEKQVHTKEIFVRWLR